MKPMLSAMQRLGRDTGAARRRRALLGGLATAAAVALLPADAWAHTAQGTLGGFASGFSHPIFGYDHLLAMLAVGLWGVQLGGSSIWTLPVVFPLIMAVGGFAGAAGVGLPGVELMIQLSMVGLGLAIALNLRPPEWAAILAVGIFAVFHGHAHGTELPAAANPVAYGVGFVLATGMIHLVGIGFGLAVGSLFDGKVTRGAGALIASTGLYFVATK
jgi:urease accessory protein